MSAIPDGYSLIETGELERLKAVDAKHGWKERPVQLVLHHFEPHRRWPWFCGKCGYAPHEPLQHYQAEPPTNNAHAL